MDINSRIKAFRLQTARRILYGKDVSWAGVACFPSEKSRQHGPRPAPFPYGYRSVDLSGLTTFYCSMLKAW